jgi:hypothetical protein
MSRAKTTPVGRMAYGSLIEPKEDPFGGCNWTVALVLKEEDSDGLLAVVETELEAARKKNPQFPKSNEKLNLPYSLSTTKNDKGEKEIVEGELLWRFKRKLILKRRTGEEDRNTPPALYDSNGRFVSDLVKEIGWGSTGKVIYTPFTYCNTMNSGVSFQLTGFQINELVKSTDIELAPIPGGFVADSAPIDDPLSVLGDEVPF